ncbi:EF-hand [Clathrospora elynae]|uniref:EF-hand n=1 Tax=Clathrospora elynae TaxID=706981 RepID=A0A6A5SGE6_9PLEO|nr:EF-hand [Clathrospora elynae]
MSSTPTSLSRYRPAILVLAGAAAAYLVFTAVASYAPSRDNSNGLQRSNAVRRRQRGPSPSPLARVEGLAPSLAPGDVPPLDGAESVAPTEQSLGSDEDDEGAAIDPEGQTLQRTLYHIAEDRARLQGVVHRGITCNGCDEKPIRGTRWHCANCVDFDLCANCEATNSHDKTHVFYKIRVPTPYLAFPKQEPLYPGSPHLMSPSIDPVLKRRLVAETQMEAEEVEALWDQFSCLAGTEWPGDTSGVGWALDRRAFNHAFVPRYNSFVAAPNLIYDRIFAYYDTDKNGLIGFDEWIKGLDGMHTADMHVKARTIFNAYDIDGDGYISRKDILRVFRAYYAIEKEATRNYVSELAEELSVRNALPTIRSAQPLGSAFPPRNMTASNNGNPLLRQKQQNEDGTTSPVLVDGTDVAGRDEILRSIDLENVTQGGASDNEQPDIVDRRWARRQYYLDEEEGLAQPEGAEAPHSTSQDPADEVQQPTGAQDTNEEHARNRCSRSSSRVRFQDDVDVDTRSNASSTRPVGERWGGYEVPEPEKDLGKEVLYQITQQGFNELLDPLFLDKEDMAMDAQETRSERRMFASAIDAMTLELFDTRKTEIEAIIHLGMFRFSKCVVDEYCKALNNGYPTFRGFFHGFYGGARTRDEARIVLERVYKAVEGTVLRSVKYLNTANLDNMNLWHTLLCQRQLQEETLNAVLDCVTNLGWIPSGPTKTSCELEVPGLYRDPTMPQFRPNSLADADTGRNYNLYATTANGASWTSELLITEAAENMVSHPKGPCFVFAEVKELKSEEPAEKENALAPAPPSTHPVPIVPANDPPFAEPPSSSVPPHPEHPTEQLPIVNWLSYTDNPVEHFLSIDSSSGLDVVCSTSRPVSHSTDIYHHEMNPVKPLQRYIRQIAMDPKSPLHLIMLASLETLEQEIKERKGSGLISFDEFAEHMRQGRLRFLESWMEWVSI